MITKNHSMNNFWSLVGFEHKKIFTAKFVILFLVLLIFISISSVGILIGNVYIDGEVSGTKYDDYLMFKSYALDLSGEEIDLELLKKARDAYALYPENGTLADQREYAEKYIDPYDAIGRFLTTYYDVSDWAEIGELSDAELANFDNMMLGAIQAKIENTYINENSKNKLLSLSEKIDTPITYQFGSGYELNVTMLASSGLIYAFFIAISLAGIFSKDYRTNVISLQHSSKKGKTLLFGAKVFTIFSVTSLTMLIVILTSTVICLSVYGTEGMDSAYQNFNRLSPYPFTIFEVMLIYFVITFVATLTFAFIVGFMSSTTKSSAAVLGIGSFMLVIPQFVNIPESFPTLYKLFSLYPTSAYVDYKIFSNMLYEIGNISVLPFVFIPIFHLVMMITLIFLSHNIYVKYQVK